MVMKTTREIWEENTIEEHIFDKFGRQRDIIRYFYNTTKNKKWYSEEELKNIFNNFKEKVEMSGSLDNNGDNSYYKAIYDIEHVLFRDD